MRLVISIKIMERHKIELFSDILVTTGNAKSSINVLRKLDVSSILVLRNMEMEMAVLSMRHIRFYKHRYGYRL